MKRRPVAIALAALVMAAGGAAVPPFRTPAPAGDDTAATAWRETRWPFLLDQWGVGRAFVCMPADCGMRIELYIRPKIGFCNCTTGVSDETELERVADTDLVSGAVRPLGPATPVAVAWMHGLARSYEVPGAGSPAHLLSVAFNDECDVVVALAAFGTADPERAAPAVTAFLHTPLVVQWARKELGLEFVHREW